MGKGDRKTNGCYRLTNGKEKTKDLMDLIKKETNNPSSRYFGAEEELWKLVSKGLREGWIGKE